MAKKDDSKFYVVSQDTAKWLDLKRDLELLRDKVCGLYEETMPDFFKNGKDNDRTLQGEFDTAFENIHKFINRGLCSSIEGQMAVSLEDKIV